MVKPQILPKNEWMDSFLILCDVFCSFFGRNQRHFEINWPLSMHCVKARVNNLASEIEFQVRIT